MLSAKHLLRAAKKMKPPTKEEIEAIHKRLKEKEAELTNNKVTLEWLNKTFSSL